MLLCCFEIQAFPRRHISTWKSSSETLFYSTEYVQNLVKSMAFRTINLLPLQILTLVVKKHWVFTDWVRIRICVLLSSDCKVPVSMSITLRLLWGHQKQRFCCHWGNALYLQWHLDNLNSYWNSTECPFRLDFFFASSNPPWDALLKFSWQIAISSSPWIFSLHFVFLFKGSIKLWDLLFQGNKPRMVKQHSKQCINSPSF